MEPGTALSQQATLHRGAGGSARSRVGFPGNPGLRWPGGVDTVRRGRIRPGRQFELRLTPGVVVLDSFSGAIKEPGGIRRAGSRWR